MAIPLLTVTLAFISVNLAIHASGGYVDPSTGFDPSLGSSNGVNIDDLPGDKPSTKLPTTSPKKDKINMKFSGKKVSEICKMNPQVREQYIETLLVKAGKIHTQSPVQALQGVRTEQLSTKKAITHSDKKRSKEQHAAARSHHELNVAQTTQSRPESTKLTHRGR